MWNRACWARGYASITQQVIADMSDTVLPERKLPKLIVVMAFDPDNEGTMQTAFGPQDFHTKDRAVRHAKE